MKPLILIAAAVVLIPVHGFGQADGCRGALDALNRVKEEITPSLTPATESGKRRLEIMRSTLTDGTRRCKSFPELWFYRMAVAQRLADTTDYTYAKKQVDDANYTTGFDPFSPPPGAAPLPQTPSTPGVANTIASTSVRKKWALVVGIDQFQDERAATLNFAVKDSRDFAAYLTSPKGGRFAPTHVFSLSDKQATLQGIREGLGRLRVLAHPDDLVVLYISSHGSPRDHDPHGVSYILTHDTNLEDAVTLYASSLQMIDLVQQINRELKARRVVLILDTCYSGDALPSANPAEPDFSRAFDNLRIGNGRAVLTASRANERSWENKTIGDGGNGYFTFYLLEVLRENRGPEDLDALFNEVSRRVAERVQADLHVSQTPSFAFSDKAKSIVLTALEAQDK